MKTLIRNATVVLPDATANLDVVIDRTKIAAIDPAPQIRVDEVIDATARRGCTCSPA
jgi:dihydroorotase-like cyclic amidohydrolase